MLEKFRANVLKFKLHSSNDQNEQELLPLLITIQIVKSHTIHVEALEHKLKKWSKFQ